MIDDMPTPPPMPWPYVSSEYARRFGFWYGLAAGHFEQRLAQRWPAWRLNAPPPATIKQMEKALRRAGRWEGLKAEIADLDAAKRLEGFARTIVEAGPGREPDAVIYDGSIYRRGSDGKVTEERLPDHDG